MNEITEPLKSKLPVKLLQWLWPLYVSIKYKQSLKLRLHPGALERLKSVANQRGIICPNHCSEFDADVLFALSRAAGEAFYYLTAHEIFHAHHNWNMRPLQLLGCYPITRGMLDTDAYKTTQSLIIAGDRKLVVFPEGEISHQNNKVEALQHGTARMSFSALDKLTAMGSGETIYLIPLALKYVYKKDIRKRLKFALSRLETAMELTVLNELAINERIIRCFNQFAVREAAGHNLQWNWQDVSVDLGSSIAKLRKDVLRGIACDLQLFVSESWTELTTAHFLKSTICDLLFHYHADTNSEPNRKRLRAQLKEVKRVIDLITLDFNRLQTPLTQEQAAEFVLVLGREIFGRNVLFGSIEALVDVGRPINLQDYARSFKSSRRQTLAQIDGLLRQELQSMLDTMEFEREKIFA